MSSSLSHILGIEGQDQVFPQSNLDFDYYLFFKIKEFSKRTAAEGRDQTAKDKSAHQYSLLIDCADAQTCLLLTCDISCYLTPCFLGTI